MTAKSTAFIRSFPTKTLKHMRQQAGARGWTQAQYLERLLALHAAMRILADEGNREVASALEQMGLETVER